MLLVPLAEALAPVPPPPPNSEGALCTAFGLPLDGIGEASENCWPRNKLVASTIDITVCSIASRWASKKRFSGSSFVGGPISDKNSQSEHAEYSSQFAQTGTMYMHVRLAGRGNVRCMLPSSSICDSRESKYLFRSVSTNFCRSETHDQNKKKKSFARPPRGNNVPNYHIEGIRVIASQWVRNCGKVTYPGSKGAAVSQQISGVCY